MNEILHDPLIQGFFQAFFSEQITLATAPVWICIAALFAIVGGALGGIALAGKDLGARLAAMIGGLYGPVAVIPAIALGLALVGFGLVA